MSTNLMLLSTLFMTQNLLSVILLQKGRSLIYRILKFTTGTELAFTSAKALLENIQIIAKKFPEDEVQNFTINTYSI